MDKMKQNYKESVVHFIGGINEYVGELDNSPHKNGENWIRIKNPCRVKYTHDQQGNQGIKLLAVYGAGILYKKYVDIRVPDDPAVEILTLLPDGELCKNYVKETSKEKSSIILPNNGLKLV